MKMNRFTLLVAALPFVLYACGSDDSGGGGGTGGKKDAGTDSGKGGTGGVGAVGGTGGAGLTGGTGGTGGGTGGTAGSGGGVAGAAGSGTGGVAGAAGGGGTAGNSTGGTAGTATGGTAGTASGGTDGGVAGSSSGGTAGTDGGVAALGDSCSNPFVVGALPYSSSGDTTGSGADYGYTGSACAPETASAGSGSPDEVYAFTPTTTGRYVVELKGQSFDSALYVATDCQNVDTTCVGGDEDICSDCTESVSVDAQAGSTYYVMVDGYSTSPPGTEGAYTVDVKAAPTNETCATAIPITTAPFQHSSNTVGATGDYNTTSGACTGVGAVGAGTGDLVYAFTPATTGTYIVSLLTDSFDAALYVSTSCSTIDSTTCLGGADDCTTDCAESIIVNGTAGTTYYIFVDGYSPSPSPGNSGAYTLYVSTPPPGDTCGTAIPVTALPFTDAGNTSGAINDYGYSAGACAPETGGWGAGSNDIVYSFTPTVTGSYTITLGGFDSTLYVVTNCADVDNTCVGGDESCFTNCDETVTTNLTAGTTYYVIVDGYDNSGNVSGAYQLDIVKNP